MRFLVFLILGVSVSAVSLAQSGTASTKLLSELPYCGEQKKIYADVFFDVPKAQTLSVQYLLYQFTVKGDSTLIIRRQTEPFNVKKGVSSKAIIIPADDKKTFSHPVFVGLLRKEDIVAPGVYKIYLNIQSDSFPTIRKTFLESVDSNLAANSSLRKATNETLLPNKETKVLGVNISQGAVIVNKTMDKPLNAIKASSKKLERMLKTRGMERVEQSFNGKQYLCFYYSGWFAGRMELDNSKSLSGQINSQKDQLANNVTSLATNELTNYKSLFSQIKTLRKDKKEEQEIEGELAVTGNWSNGQQEYSGQDNNFYEVRGRVATEVFDIPIGFEGYYTTQDQHRIVKSSYVRVHYDVEKAKANLTKLIDGYKNQYEQTVSKGAGISQIYGSYLNNLSNQKGQMINDLKKETGISDLDPNNFNATQLKQQITATVEKQMSDSAKANLAKDSVPSLTNKPQLANQLTTESVRAKAVADSADRLYQKALKRYEQIQALEQTYQKYNTLLGQYKNTNYFDSAMAISKMKNLESGDETTYKQLAKSASALLPEGKAKTFLAGLTELDAGTLNKYTSKYTMAGQRLNGLSVGYDLSVVQIGAAVGSTQYASRNGGLDKYTTYSGNLSFMPVKGSKVQLTYMAYTPKTAGDSFYKKMDVALPSFTNPTHIVSLTYEGTIAKNIHIETEGATSYKNGDNTPFSQSFDANRTAWHMDVDGMIPKTLINVKASVEHGGKDFENSTLPTIIAGTDLYKVGAKGDFFRSFLTLGIEYNRMIQSSFTSSGGNNRWGFEVNTHSKQYPSISLSYKPFATFRSYNDTLNVPQRPLVGSVLTGKASYQIKRVGGKSWRFTAVVNKSSSEMDTSKYGSNLLQIGCIYATKLYTLNLTAGNNQLSASGVDSTSPAHQSTRFVMMAASTMLNKQTSISGGGDIGFAHFGLSKYGWNVGLIYRLKKTPLTVRLNGRYITYQLIADEGWKKFYSGSADLAWQFRMKHNK